MEFEKTSIPDVLVVTPRRFVDSRGFFAETFNERTFNAHGPSVHFIQDNLSYSAKRGTIRGLHFQLPPASQAKLVRVQRGRIFDVAVDLRIGSPTFAKWVGKTLSAEAGEQLFVPRGFAHGFCTLEDHTEVTYKVDNYYAPELDSGVIWNDSSLGIDWPVDSEAVVLSDKDQKLQIFSKFTSPFYYRAEG